MSKPNSPHSAVKTKKKMMFGDHSQGVKTLASGNIGKDERVSMLRREGSLAWRHVCEMPSLSRYSPTNCCWVEGFWRSGYASALGDCLVTMFLISGRVTGRSLHIKINTPTTGAPTFDKSHTIENSFGFFVIFYTRKSQTDATYTKTKLKEICL